MRDVGLDLNNIQNLSKELIIRKINVIDEQNWKNEMSTKETLRRYRNYKKCIEETPWLRNGFKYELLMRARADALPLNWRKFHSESKTCSLCNAEDETLAHFLLDCKRLQTTRNRYTILQLPRIENVEAIINYILMFNEKEKPSEKAEIILQLWLRRNSILQEENEQIPA